MTGSDDAWFLKFRRGLAHSDVQTDDPRAGAAARVAPESTTSLHARSLPGWLVLLALILAFGLWVRVANLGGPDLHIDEVVHVFAAAELVKGHAPTLPSGQQYRRALLYTYLMALVARFGEVNEWTARLPSVIFGTLTIGLVFLMGRTWYSASVGLIAAFVAAASPMQIAYSREARMYAMFQFVFLLVLFTFFQGLETPVRRPAWTSRSSRFHEFCKRHHIRPFMLLAAIALVPVARQLHELIYPGLTGPVAYVGLMALAAVVTGTRLRVNQSKYGILALLMIVAGVSFAVATNVFDRNLSYVPAWAAKDSSPWYYVSNLTKAYPIVLSSVLIGAALACTQNARATLYVLTCFTVPLAIHSLVFAWKHERYILHVVPLLFIVFGVAASAVTQLVYEALLAWVSRTVTMKWQRVIAAACTALVVGFMLAFMPWARLGVAVPLRQAGAIAGLQHQDWRVATRFVRQRASSSDVVIASAPGLALYYGQSLPMYYVGIDGDIQLEVGHRDAEGRPADYISGATLLLTLPALKDVMSRHPSGWVMSERYRFRGSGWLPPGVREYIEAHAQPEDVPDAPSMVVWRW